jgi:hypothetical protein
MQNSISNSKDSVIKIGPNQGLPCYERRPCSTSGTCDRHIIGAIIELPPK